MRDRGFVCIWNDSVEEAVKEFINFNLNLTEDKEGAYTFLFCRYEEYRLVTDVLYASVYKNTVLFFWAINNSLVLELDEHLNVIDGTGITREETTVMHTLFDKPNIVHLDELITTRGNCFEVFTLKETESKEAGEYLYTKLFKSRLVDPDKLIIRDEDLIDISLKYLKHRIETFDDIVDEAIEKDEDDPRLTENPMANRYYDKDDMPQPLKEKRMLGDNNV